MRRCRGRSHSNITAVRLFIPSWFTPGYIHAVMLFPKANHFCIPHPISHRCLGAFSVGLNCILLCSIKTAQVGWGISCVYLCLWQLAGWVRVWVNWVRCNFSQGHIHAHWVTQLLISPVLPCPQIPPCRSVSPGVSACHCKVLGVCFTESFSIWI